MMYFMIRRRLRDHFAALAVDVGKYQLATSLGTKWPNLFMKRSVEGIRKGAKQKYRQEQLETKNINRDLSTLITFGIKRVGI